MLKEEEIGSSKSGLSFADMLASADNVKPLKPKKAKTDWKTAAVDMSYVPSKHLNFEPTIVVKQSGMCFVWILLLIAFTNKSSIVDRLSFLEKP